MRFLTVADAKKHCRIESDVTDDDTYLETVTIPAAELRVENRIKRKIYATEQALTDANDLTGIVIDETLKMAMYMFCYDLYENRASQETESFYFNSAVKEILSTYVNHE